MEKYLGKSALLKDHLYKYNDKKSTDQNNTDKAKDLGPDMHLYSGR